MTLVDFYQVVSETNKTVMLEEIGSIVVEGNGGFYGTVKADPTKRTGKFFRAYKREEKNGGFHLASKLDKSTTYWLYETDENKTHNFNHLD